MDIIFNGKQPIPAIYNVKQYSSGVDEFIFKIAKNLFKSDMSGAEFTLKTSEFTVSPEVSEDEEYFILRWLPGVRETAKAGAFVLQAEIKKGDVVWQSYEAAFIVSKSLEDVPPMPEGDALQGVLWRYGEIFEGIRGKEEMEDSE